MEQKYKKGFRVEILSRNTGLPANRRAEWENSSVGCEAIIISSIFEEQGRWGKDDSDYDNDTVLYRILILDPKGKTRTLHWFEEKFLELICWNEEKGKAVLAEYERRRERA